MLRGYGRVMITDHSHFRSPSHNILSLHEANNRDVRPVHFYKYASPRNLYRDLRPAGMGVQRFIEYRILYNMQLQLYTPF
jgi:hypothetical protein